MVRGKAQAKVEFGSKIHLSLVDGVSFLDELSWDAFNEGSHMMDYVEKYRLRFGCYPRKVLADQIYCTRANRAALKEKGIRLLAKPPGRPSAVPNHVSPGERKTGLSKPRWYSREREESIHKPLPEKQSAEWLNWQKNIRFRLSPWPEWTKTT